MTDKNIKGRDWTFIVYPESAPDNWRDVLNETHMRWVESPLHDKDVDPNGEIKKSHWHILLSSDGPITKSSVLKIVEPLNVPMPMKVGSAKGLIRYMTHMDNPEKYQYEASDIVAHNGADIASYLEMTKTDKIIVMKEIMTYIYENEINNYAEFVMDCIQTSDEWFDVAINHNTLAINKMIDAMWHRNRNKADKQ